MFQIEPLSASEFADLSTCGPDELFERGVQVHVSDGGYPCRVSLEDVPAGRRVFLLNYEHQPNASPYRSRHAIFVAEGAREHRPAPGAVPASISDRLLSVRGFNSRHEIVDAEVVEGNVVHLLIERMLAVPEIAYIHLHYARRGCFAAKVIRA